MRPEAKEAVLEAVLVLEAALEAEEAEEAEAAVLVAPPLFCLWWMAIGSKEGLEEGGREGG